jgi:hypothetical protein
MGEDRDKRRLRRVKRNLAAKALADTLYHQRIKDSEDWRNNRRKRPRPTNIDEWNDDE